MTTSGFSPALGKLLQAGKIKEVCELLAPFDLAGLLEKLYGDGVPEKLVLANPRYVEGFKDIFNEKTFGCKCETEYNCFSLCSYICKSADSGK